MKRALFLSLLISISCIPNAFAVSGCTLLVDDKDGSIIKQEGECTERYSPASTFKIALALIGYDSGILIDEYNPTWSYQDSYAASLEMHRQTTGPLLWEKNSVVWYSQKLSTTLGTEKFKGYINLLNYGNKDLSGDVGKNNGLTRSWLGSSLKISPIEQVQFIRDMLRHTFKLSKKSYVMTKAILPEFETESGWRIHGKTGTSNMADADGIADKNRPVGWFVGWAEKDDKIVAFAKLILGDEPFTISGGLKARDELFAEFP